VSASVRLNPEPDPNRASILQQGSLPRTSRETRRFRALKVGGRRKAFSLEPEFWTVLEEAARQAGVRIGEYVARCSGDVPSGNVSSVLRRCAISWLVAERERLRPADPVSLAKRVTDAINSPALVITDRKRIVAHNRSFLNLGARPGAEHVPERLGAVHLRLSAPVSTILERLEKGGDRSLRVDYILDFGVHRRVGSLNATVLERNEETSYLLCVLREGCTG
jgi:predicted DNA-binding ribbon-helix-helix protein